MLEETGKQLLGKVIKICVHNIFFSGDGGERETMLNCTKHQLEHT